MWMNQTISVPPPTVTRRPLHVAIAIPARNEEALIVKCLTALDRAAANAAPANVSIFVLVNNSSDTTAALARGFNADSCSIYVEHATLSDGNAHAGGARRYAMDKAALIAGVDGVIMTSDADSEVSPNWIAANLTELSNGVDAVAGSITLKADDRKRLKPMLLARAPEWRLAELQAKIITLLDPLDHDPWPTHIWAWGASLAVTCQAYRAVGGLPSIPLAEDRAFAELLDRHDFKLRHSHSPIVFTSGRLAGRAPLGLADLLSDYCAAPDTPCDAAIEPTLNLVTRLFARNSFRRKHGTHKGFGARWQVQDAQIMRERLYPAQLASEISYATALISRLEKFEKCRADIQAAGPDILCRTGRGHLQKRPRLDHPFLDNRA